MMNAFQGVDTFENLMALSAKERDKKRALMVKVTAARVECAHFIRGYLKEILGLYKELLKSPGGSIGRKGFTMRDCKQEILIEKSIELLRVEMKKFGIELNEPQEIAAEEYDNAYSMRKAYAEKIEFWSGILADPNTPWA